MKTEELFTNSPCADEMHKAERELAAFIGAVTDLFGPEQARLSADDWLDESELVDIPRRSTSRDWRAVTVAASARLTNRLALAAGDRTGRNFSTRDSRGDGQVEGRENNHWEFIQEIEYRKQCITSL